MILHEKVKTFKEFQRMADELEADMEAVKDAIKTELAAQGVEELTAGEYKVRWSVVESSRLDTAALRKAAPDLCQQFTRTTRSKRFFVA